MQTNFFISSNRFQKTNYGESLAKSFSFANELLKTAAEAIASKIESSTKG